MQSFSNFFRKRNPDQEHIDAFHEAHAHLHELGKVLHEKGYHINIEYPDKQKFRTVHAAGGPKGGTTFFNHDLFAKKKISISKSALRDE